MSKQFLSVILLSLFAICQNTFADKHICKSIQGCQAVNNQEEAKTEELSSVDSRKIASNADAIFIPDNSNDKLGEAYKDPSGLIWGNIVTKPVDTNRVFLTRPRSILMSQSDANKYCKDIGARLPTKEEFENLAKYLGKGSYKPYLADGDTEYLPGLYGHWFWSSTDDGPDFPDYAFMFNGSQGYTRIYNRTNRISVRCVAGR